MERIVNAVDFEFICVWVFVLRLMLVSAIEHRT